MQSLDFVKSIAVNENVESAVVDAADKIGYK